MRYEKPVVMDLDARARFADGQGSLSCMDGTGPGYAGVCGAGTGPAYPATCMAGYAASECAGGSSALFTCLSGLTTVNLYECAFGAGVGGACTAGPSHVP